MTPPDFNANFRRERMLGRKLVKPRTGRSWRSITKFVRDHREEIESARDLDAAYTVLCERTGQPDRSEPWLAAALMACHSLKIRVAGFGLVIDAKAGAGAEWVKIDVDQKGTL